MLTLACGPYLTVDGPGLVASIVIFVLFKPVAYFAFIQAFRYRVSRSVPMTFGRAAKLALARAGLGIVLFASGVGIVALGGDEGTLLAWSWVYLYSGRAGAWFVVGRWGAVLRGRRLAGWVISGTLINAAFDVAAVGGLLAGWQWPAVVLLGLGTFIVVLHVMGRRATLKARFTTSACRRCNYDLTGNLSGRCPECSAAIAA